MKLILLPGNSISNKEWIQEIEESLKVFFESTKIHYYNHWEIDDKIINLDLELRRLCTEFEPESFIFAKSVGVLLALKGVAKEKIKPKSCIFLGTPVNWSDSNNIPVRDWLKKLTIKCLFIQNSNDPAYPAQKLKKLLKELNVKEYKLFETSGNNHDYENIEELKKIISEFINNDISDHNPVIAEIERKN